MKGLKDLNLMSSVPDYRHIDRLSCMDESISHLNRPSVSNFEKGEKSQNSQSLSYSADEVRKFIEDYKSLQEALAQEKATSFALRAQISSLAFQIEEYKSLISGYNASLPDFYHKCPPETNTIKQLKDLIAEKDEKIRILNEEFRLLSEEKNRYEAAIKGLQKQNKELLEKCSTPIPDSGNSGLNPSSDVKQGYKKGRKTRSDHDNPLKDEKQQEKRKQGAQPGHKRHEHTPFRGDEAEIVEHCLPDESICSDCGSELVREPLKDKQKDSYVLPPVETKKEIHKFYAYRCSRCGKIHYSSTPREIENIQLLSSSVLDELAILRIMSNATTRNLHKYLSDYRHINVSTGFISESINKHLLNLRASYLELFDAVKNQPQLNIDEAVTRCFGHRAYAWGFSGKEIVFFKIGTRSGNMLNVVLGDEYQGNITSDCFRPYLSYAFRHPGVKAQLCWSHLSRDFQHCIDHLNKEVHDFGKQGKEYIRDIFHTYHQLQKFDDKESPEALGFIYTLKELQEKFTVFAAAAPNTASKTRGIASRFTSFPEFYFEFTDNFNVEPTNNEAERINKTVVLNKKISIGMQSFTGIKVNEAIWSTVLTLSKQGRSVIAFLRETSEAALECRPGPSLLKAGKTVDPKFVEMANQELAELKRNECRLMKLKRGQKSVSEIYKFFEEHSSLIPDSNNNTEIKSPAGPENSKTDTMLFEAEEGCPAKADNQETRQKQKIGNLKKSLPKARGVISSRRKLNPVTNTVQKKLHKSSAKDRPVYTDKLKILAEPIYVSEKMFKSALNVSSSLCRPAKTDKSDSIHDETYHPISTAGRAGQLPESCSGLWRLPKRVLP